MLDEKTTTTQKGVTSIEDRKTSYEQQHAEL